MSGAAGAASSAAAARANAIKASGAIVRVDPTDFLSILRRAGDVLVVRSEGGLFSKQYRYLTSYKGLIFVAKSPAPLDIPRQMEIITANKIWIPD